MSATSDKQALAELLSLPDLSGVPVEKLIRAAKYARQHREQLHEFAGRAIAEMNRNGLTFAQIATLIEIPDSTAHRWAKPYL